MFTNTEIRQLIQDQHDCETCLYNIGIYQSSGRIDGPCGQQNCWYLLDVELELDEDDFDELEWEDLF